MAYIPTIPQANDNLSTSQAQILGNFSALNTEFALNHYAWDAASYPGLHKKIDFPLAITDPAITGAGDGSVIYAKDISAIAQLFFRNSAGIQQLSGAILTANANGGVDFPFGLSLRWGTFSYTSTSTNISFATPFPNNAWLVVMTPRTLNSAGHAPAADVVSASQFNVLSNTGSSATRVAYIAVGN